MSILLLLLLTVSNAPSAFSKTVDAVRHMKKLFDVKNSLKKKPKYMPRKGECRRLHCRLYTVAMYISTCTFFT